MGPANIIDKRVVNT